MHLLIAIKSFLSKIFDLLTTNSDTVNGGFDVNIQSGFAPITIFFAMQFQKSDILLTSPAVLDNDYVDVSAGHGFTGAPGEQIYIGEGMRFLQADVLSVNINRIYIATLVDNAFTTSATVVRGNKNLAVNGSVTPVLFSFYLPGFDTAVDVSEIRCTMQHGADVPDDGKFGGIAELVKGLFIQKSNTTKFNLGNYRKNKDFIHTGATVEYTDKAPAGTNGTNVFYPVEDVFKQVIRVDPRINERIDAHVRDDLSTLAEINISYLISYTVGE